MSTLQQIGAYLGAKFKALESRVTVVENSSGGGGVMFPEDIPRFEADDYDYVWPVDYVGDEFYDMYLFIYFDSQWNIVGVRVSNTSVMDSGYIITTDMPSGASYALVVLGRNSTGNTSFDSRDSSDLKILLAYKQGVPRP